MYLTVCKYPGHRLRVWESDNVESALSIGRRGNAPHVVVRIKPGFTLVALNVASEILEMKGERS